MIGSIRRPLRSKNFEGDFQMNTKDVIETRESNQEVKDFRHLAQLKISATVITTITWLAFNLYWIAFLWGGYSIFQNLILLIVFFLVFSAVISLLWILE
jgi:hypothetical protein